MNKKILSSVLFFLGSTVFLLAEEPQGGTLIQMSTVGVVTMLLALFSLKSENGGKNKSKFLKLFSKSKR